MAAKGTQGPEQPKRKLQGRSLRYQNSHQPPTDTLLTHTGRPAAGEGRRGVGLLSGQWTDSLWQGCSAGVCSRCSFNQPVVIIILCSPPPLSHLNGDDLPHGVLLQFLGVSRLYLGLRDPLLFISKCA